MSRKTFLEIYRSVYFVDWICSWVKLYFKILFEFFMCTIASHANIKDKE